MVIEDVAGVMWVTTVGRAPHKARAGTAGRVRQRRSRGSPRVLSRCPRGRRCPSRRCPSRRRSAEAASSHVSEALALQPFNFSIFLSEGVRKNRLVFVLHNQRQDSVEPLTQKAKPASSPSVRRGSRLNPLCDNPERAGGRRAALLADRVGAVCRLRH